MPAPAPAPPSIDEEPAGLPGAGLDAVTGEAVPNTTYLGQRLLYEKPPEDSFDPLVSFRYFIELARHAALTTSLWFMGLIVLLVLVLWIAGDGNGFVILLVLWSIALAAVFWFRPIPALLSEWKFSIDGKGDVAPVAFEHISWALQRRQTPLDSTRVRRIALPGRENRDYLELRRGIFAGFVSCFAYGRDLFIGWTFWLYLSPFHFMLMSIARGWQTLRLRGSELYLTLRYDSAKAMREAMHGAAREGIDVAAGYVAPRGQGTIGSEIPVESFTLPTPASAREPGPRRA